MDSTPPAPDTVAVTVVHSPACHFCEDARAVLADLATEFPLTVEFVDCTEPRGAALIREHRAGMYPLVLLDGGFLQRRPVAAQEAAGPAQLARRGGGVMGSQLLTTGSVLAAFFAGGVALFAPCCIVFLAPSYMAVAVKNRRWRLLPLTFVFAAGLALVLVPITLGMSLIAATIANYHTMLYYLGGALMLLLAAYSLSGRMWSLPSFLRAPDTARGDSASFFALGVFSGIASSCCAPVLAGVMTLSALSGSAIGGITLGLAYVLGMTFPLFVMALLWDRLRLGERRWMQAKTIRIRIARWTLVPNTINIAVAAGFAVMGGFIIYLANTGTMTSGPGFQVAIGEFLTTVFARIETWTQPVPEAILGLAVLAVAAVFVVATLHGRRHTPPADPSAAPEPAVEPGSGASGEPPAGDPPCHSHTDSTITGMPS